MLSGCFDCSLILRRCLRNTRPADPGSRSSSLLRRAAGPVARRRARRRRLESRPGGVVATFGGVDLHLLQVLIVGLLPGDVLRTLFAKIEIKLERVVDLGPFKHKVDDGLPLRKAALSCVNTILENCPQQMDAAAFMPFIALGLADKV